MGGVAILKAASQIPSIKAVITIATPSSPKHLSHLLREKRNTALQEGSAEVTIGGRSFTLSKEFFHDLESHQMEKTISNLGKPLLLLHSLEDQT
ncbi:MAG: osmotically inducible protein C, partial [Gammaproteobacteria bacterium]|nr:osmotically inducible protein C [Gammaproteobacteria bacterium]NIR95336.1 osmotically inducible protein C [Gammaproteobacteria bacterium]NIT54369.1 osmotically inducible protein C [candidate division Zixibacteria bacterium]NIW42877.1 osmotically inducible protein C [candidate division Zixibacteria bacterium]NIX58501.1 osmotically inducible protein C [candidate division Zixibacteria bacterium]